MHATSFHFYVMLYLFDWCILFYFEFVMFIWASDEYIGSTDVCCELLFDP